MNKRAGFTIVEIIVVIVVIGILVAISIVAYNGIQQRAINTARINYAEQLVKLAKVAAAFNDANGVTYLNGIDGKRCLISNYTCTSWDGTDFTGADSNTATDGVAYLAAAGNLPSTSLNLETPQANGPTIRGIGMDRYYQRTYNDKPAPVEIWYTLIGEKQDCGISSTTARDPSKHPEDNIDAPKSANYYLSRNNYTICAIPIPEIR